MDAYLNLLKPRGVMTCVGLPEKAAESKTTMFMHSIVPTEKTVVGSYLGSRAEYDAMLEFSAKFSIFPQVEVVPFAEANAAVAKCKAGQARYRMVVKMDSTR